jgi:hypothetical protein
MRAAGSVTNCTKGLESSDWKPTPTVIVGVLEVRIRDGSGAYRVIDVASLSDTFMCCTRPRRNRKDRTAGPGACRRATTSDLTTCFSHSTKRLQLSRAAGTWCDPKRRSIIGRVSWRVYDIGDTFRRGRCGDRRPFVMGIQDARPRIECRHPSSNEFVSIPQLPAGSCLIDGDIC